MCAGLYHWKYVYLDKNKLVIVYSSYCGYSIYGKAIISILIVSHHCPILEGRIKIDYLVKNHVHQQFFVEMLF